MADLANGGHAGDAAGGLDDGDLKAVRFEGDPVRVPAAADREQLGNDAVDAEAAADHVQQQQIVLGRQRRRY